MGVNSFLDYYGVSFNQLCPTHKTPIQYKRVCSACGGQEIPYGNLLSGLQLRRGEFAIVDKSLFSSLEKHTDIVAVIPTDSEYEYLTEKCYLLSPDTNNSKAYFLLREILLKSGKSVVIQYVLRKKQNLGIIKPISIKGFTYLMLKQILYCDKIKDVSVLDELGVKEEEYELAKQLFELIVSKLQKIDYKQIKDERKAILEKYLNGELKVEEEVEKVHKVDDLLEQMKNAIELEKVKEKKIEEKKKVKSG
jgi:DNA end-binding protein Ku